MKALLTSLAFLLAAPGGAADILRGPDPVAFDSAL